MLNKSELRTLLIALNYAQSNVDDINDALTSDECTSDEFETLAAKMKDLVTIEDDDVLTRLKSIIVRGRTQDYNEFRIPFGTVILGKHTDLGAWDMFFLSEAGLQFMIDDVSPPE